MMDAFRIELHAINPAKNNFRFYRIESGLDLFGDFLVVIRFGRIGTRGSSRTFVVENADEARLMVAECMKKRQTAPRRIGVEYRIRDLFDPQHWWTDRAL